MNNGDFPSFFVNVYQRVYHAHFALLSTSVLCSSMLGDGHQSTNLDTQGARIPAFQVELSDFTWHGDRPTFCGKDFPHLSPHPHISHIIHAIFHHPFPHFPQMFPHSSWPFYSHDNGRGTMVAMAPWPWSWGALITALGFGLQWEASLALLTMTKADTVAAGWPQLPVDFGDFSAKMEQKVPWCGVKYGEIDGHWTWTWYMWYEVSYWKNKDDP